MTAGGLSQLAPGGAVAVTIRIRQWTALIQMVASA
jgi:hypothetical protein